MDTQLVRLDSPYNIICSSSGKFALHIATLIVVKEKTRRVVEGAPMRDKLSVASYPVVSDGYGMDGQVWMTTELQDCLVVCREKGWVRPYDLKKVMEYCAKHNVPFLQEHIPTMFVMALFRYGAKLYLEDKNGTPISDYEVRLVFEENNDGKSCMVYSSDDSAFYFYEYFDNEPPFTKLIPTNSEAIGYVAKLRDAYLHTLHPEGLRSIRFTTRDEKYQWFVDKLNKGEVDGGKKV